MSVKHVVGRGLLIVGGLFVIGLVVFWLNARSMSCPEGHNYLDEINRCYYEAGVCGVDEAATLINGVQACTYKPKGFLGDTLINRTLMALGAGWFVLFLALLFITAKESSMLGGGGFRSADAVSPDRAIDLWEEWFARRYGIPLLNDSPKAGAFSVINGAETTQKGKEWFLKSEIVVNDGDAPGVYTIETSLSRGEDWIREGRANWRPCTYDEYKRARDWPLWSPEDPQERMLSALYERNPERAVEIQEELIERRLQAAPLAAPSAPQQEEVQPEAKVVRVPYRPPYRRPYRRPSYKRW